MPTRRLTGAVGAIALLAACGGEPAAKMSPLRPLPLPLADTEARALSGLWMDERPEAQIFYWLKGDGTGERLRVGAGWRDQIPVLLTWHAEGDHLVVTLEGDNPHDWGAIALDAEFGRLTLQGPEGDRTWFGCASGRLPDGFAGLCRMSGF